MTASAIIAARRFEPTPCIDILEAFLSTWLAESVAWSIAVAIVLFARGKLRDAARQALLKRRSPRLGIRTAGRTMKFRLYCGCIGL